MQRKAMAAAAHAPRKRGWRAALLRPAAWIVAAAAAAGTVAHAQFNNFGNNGSASRLGTRSSNSSNSRSQFGNANQSTLGNRSSRSNRSSGQFGNSLNDRGSLSERNDDGSRSSRRDRSDRSSNSRRRERRDDRNNGTENVVGVPVGQGEQGRATIQGRSAAPRSAPGGAKPPAKAKTPIELPKITLSPDIVTDTLYFAAQSATAKPGEKFSTSLLFFNSKANEIDAIDIWLHCDPQLLSAAWINVDSIYDDADGDLVKETWRKQGYVHLQGRFDPPLKQVLQPLATFTWEAGDTPAPTEIAIEAPEGRTVGVYKDGVNLLERSGVGNKGLVSLPVAIEDPNAALPEDRPFRLLAEGEDPMAPAKRVGRGARLGLVPKEDATYPGEVSTIDVALVNPDAKEFDELRFRVRFDPEAVQILDADEDNYMTAGVNIYDGGFHDRMRFDKLLANNVDQERGEIEYHAINDGGPRVYPTGTVARIVFRMKKEAGAAAFWFEGEDPLSGRMASDIRSRGRSLLGNPDEKPETALHNARVLAAPL